MTGSGAMIAAGGLSLLSGVEPKVGAALLVAAQPEPWPYSVRVKSGGALAAA